MPAVKTVTFLTLLIFAILSGIYAVRLSRPGLLVWDEQYHVPAAQSYLVGYKPAYWNRRNPPLGKQMIALSIRALGDNFRAYRLPSSLSAAAVAALLFFTTIGLTRRWEGGALALLLWMSSTLAFLHARLAMLDMMTTLFFFAAISAFLPVLRGSEGKNTSRWLLLACLLAALATTVKVIGLLLFPLFLLGLIAQRHAWPLRKSLPLFMASSLGFTLLAVTISYGVLGFSPLELPEEFRRMVALQEFQHKNYTGLSSWYEWFVARGQLWYLSKPGEDGRRFGALCVQNPVLFGVGTLACLALALRAALRRESIDIFLAAAIPSQVLFWWLLKDQTILSYALPMVPVFCLCIAYALNLLTPASARYRIWGLCLAMASGFFFYKAFPKVWGAFLP